MGKSSNNHSQRGNNSNNNSSKPYALMLLLAFGAAILGVMVLHKLREKRIFTLLLKEKDHELHTLHLLFQREKEFNEEARKKIEEMKNKVYSLRSQKLELNRRQVEMESTISALKDERKVIELTLEEKRHEIQMLTTAMNSSAGDPTQSMIQMKDGELEDLKLQLIKLGVKLETSRTSELQLRNDSSTNRSQNDGMEDEHLTDAQPNKLSNVKEKERELVSVHLKREKFDNEETERVDFQDGKVKVVKSKEKNGSHHEEPQQNQGQEKQTYTSFRAGSLVSKGKKRETLRNRALGNDLFSTESTPGLAGDEQTFERNRGEKGEKEFDHKDQFERPGKYQSTAEETQQEREKKSTEMKSNGTDTQHMDAHGKSTINAKTKLVNHGRSSNVDSVEKNVGKQIAGNGEVNMQLNDQEAGRKQETVHRNEAKLHQNNNEQANEQGEGGEDSEEAQVREPEIDRDDIKRFSESDPDEEAEETEF